MTTEVARPWRSTGGGSGASCYQWRCLVLLSALEEGGRKGFASAALRGAVARQLVWAATGGEERSGGGGGAAPDGGEGPEGRGGDRGCTERRKDCSLLVGREEVVKKS